MTPSKPEVKPESRYSIVDTAQHLGVSRRTVERYIKKGIIASHYRKATNKRFVTGLEIIKAWNQTW